MNNTSKTAECILEGKRRELETASPMVMDFWGWGEDRTTDSNYPGMGGKGKGEGGDKRTPGAGDLVTTIK